jgi:hypothetical protein
MPNSDSPPLKTPKYTFLAGNKIKKFLEKRCGTNCTITYFIIFRKNLKCEQDYCDMFGKLWHFHANIGKNISKDKLLKFGFSYIRKKLKTINLYCRKSNPDGGQCPFTGIYLKSNGCLYTRGEHEHTKRGVFYWENILKIKIIENSTKYWRRLFGYLWQNLEI